MQNKLQELTDKLYNEGLSKGKKEADDLVANARNEAAKIISEAKKEAENIILDAKKQASEMEIRVAGDIKMASAQTIGAIKQQVENLLVTKVITAPVRNSLQNTEFIKTVIITIAKAFNASNPEPISLSVILPETLQKELDTFIKEEASRILGNNLEVSFSRNIKGGFKIGPSGQGYVISFSEDDFENMLAGYLRPATKKLLFG